MRFRELCLAIKAGLTGGGKLRRRLLAYLILLALLLMAFVAAALALLGVFSTVESDAAALLRAHLSTYVRGVTAHYGGVAAQGIRLSETLSEIVGKHGPGASAFNDDPARLYAVQQEAYAALADALARTEASGAFFILDATVNTGLAEGAESRSGVYLKLANVNAAKPVDAELLLYRGAMELARAQGISPHNKWDLEVDVSKLPAYAMLKAQQPGRLAERYCIGNAAALPGTWERAMALYVPIYRADGAFLGVCGFEISAIYYKHVHASAVSDLNHVTGVLARLTDGGRTLDVSAGLESGVMDGYFSKLGVQTLQVARLRSFALYAAEKAAYIGMQEAVSLAPLAEDGSAGSWTVAVMVPKEDYDAAVNASKLKFFLAAGGLFLLAVFGSACISRKYVLPILSGLELLKSPVRTERSGVPEIDDLMDYLAAQDALAQKAEPEASGNEAEDDAAFAHFVENTATLSAAERAVFDLYLKGLTAREIAETLYLSINTIKTHNRRIYAKLNVSSRKELMAFIRRMQAEPK